MWGALLARSGPAVAFAEEEKGEERGRVAKVEDC